jgi:hypothetical protein
LVGKRKRVLLHGAADGAAAELGGRHCAGSRAGNGKDAAASKKPEPEANGTRKSGFFLPFRAV